LVVFFDQGRLRPNLVIFPHSSHFAIGNALVQQWLFMIAKSNLVTETKSRIEARITHSAKPANLTIQQVNPQEETYRSTVFMLSFGICKLSWHIFPTKWWI
jgi:hypothetical protein